MAKKKGGPKMTSRDFCYWLQGFLEVGKPKTLTAPQLEQVKKHLHLVFLHEIDPSAGDAKEQKKLNDTHGHVPPHSHFSASDTLLRC